MRKKKRDIHITSWDFRDGAIVSVALSLLQKTKLKTHKVKAVFKKDIYVWFTTGSFTS